MKSGLYFSRFIWFWEGRKCARGLMGGLQVVVTSIVIGGAAMALGLAWPAALAVGMIVAMSSTAIVLQSLNEKGLLKSPGGQSSFAILLFQDIAVIPMLAVFPLLAVAPVATSGEMVAASELAPSATWPVTRITSAWPKR